MHFRGRVTRFIFVAALVPLISQCSLTARRLDSRGMGSGLIVRDKVFLERTSARNGLVVRFETRENAQCELYLWSQDSSAEPKKSNPKKIACAATPGQKSFAEVISGLSADVLYTVRLVAWKAPGGGGRDEAVVSEGADAGEAKELLVARFNSPLRTAEVHRHRLAGTLNAEQLRAQLQAEFGCKAGLDFQSFGFSKADSNVRIQNLMTRGFATSVAARHQHSANFMRMSFNSLQTADQWEWLYTLDGKSHGFIARQAGLFLQVEVEGAASKVLDDPQLTIADDAIEIAPARAITIRWSAENLAEASHVRVQVGNPGQDGAFHCYFSSQIGSGALDEDLLKGLTSGFYDLHISLDSYQIHMLPGQGVPPWMIASHDWRTTRLKKP